MSVFAKYVGPFRIVFFTANSYVSASYYIPLIFGLFPPFKFQQCDVAP